MGRAAALLSGADRHTLPYSPTLPDRSLEGVVVEALAAGLGALMAGLEAAARALAAAGVGASAWMLAAAGAWPQRPQVATHQPPATSHLSSHLPQARCCLQDQAPGAGLSRQAVLPAAAAARRRRREACQTGSDRGQRLPRNCSGSL